MMYPEHPTSDAMRELVAWPIEGITQLLAAKTDEELAEPSVRTFSRLQRVSL